MLILNPDAYRLVVRPLLFGLPPETAQKFAEAALRQRLVWRALALALGVRSPRLRANLCGLKLDNPIGLAAGYDKDCEFLPSMAAMGFGYVVGGTVTESPRPGNPRPRVLRHVKEESLINALGFPGKGLEFAARRLEQDRGRFGSTPVVVSVSGVTEDEIVRCHRRLEPLADAIEINISSPNTARLRVFHEPPTLGSLLDRVNDGRKKPLFVKLPPYAPVGGERPPEVSDREGVLGLAGACRDRGVDALTVANTWPTRDARLAVGMGGLSGRLIFQDTLRMVADLRAEVGHAMAINACGGIYSGEDALLALQAGASTVQLLTALIYRGPGVARRVNLELLGQMEKSGLEALSSS